MCAPRKPATIYSKKTYSRGAAVLELILGLPLLIILLLAVVEYGVLLSSEQQLEMAARAGGLVATNIPLPTSGSVPNDVIDAISSELENAGIDVDAGLANGTILVRLEHNYDPNSSDDLDPSVVLESGTLNCPPGDLPNPPDPDASLYGRTYVRVTVCVRSDLLTPNLLSTYCIDMSERVTAQSKTYRHNL